MVASTIHPDNSMEPNDTNVDTPNQFAQIESYLASIRAASWVTAIGILALVFFYIK
jgi:hypothetical protein